MKAVITYRPIQTYNSMLKLSSSLKPQWMVNSNFQWSRAKFMITVYKGEFVGRGKTGVED